MGTYTVVFIGGFILTLVLHLSAMAMVARCGPNPSPHQQTVINNLLNTSRFGYLSLIGLLAAAPMD